MKPFNLEQAKAGAPVCTRDGRPARIVCYDMGSKGSYPILALVKDEDGVEDPAVYKLDGRYVVDLECDDDLMMASVKREGWVNLYTYPRGVTSTDQCTLYPSEKEARSQILKGNGVYVATVKIEWEE